MAKATRRSAKTKKIQRRTPQRARSEATVAAIFEATTRILRRGGREAFNTNRVAEIAGISVGTLYGYFPDKQAILLAMARQELNAAREHVEAALLDMNSDVHPARRAVRALMEAYRKGGKPRRILMETLFMHGGSDELARPVSEIAEAIIAGAGKQLPPGPERLSPIGLFVLTRAVDSVVRLANYEEKDFAGSQEFEDELVRLVFSFIGWPAPDAFDVPKRRRLG